MPVRAHGLESLRSVSGVPIEFVTEDTLSRWILPGAPLHPTFPMLSAVHKADHLRTYLMHHHGGGYADIKPTTGSWIPAFEAVERDGLLGAGYPEVGRHSIARLGLELSRRLQLQPFKWDWWRYRWLQLNVHRLIGNCAYIFRPRSHFTAGWLCEQTRRLDRLQPLLEAEPARHPKERGGRIYDGRVSRYPVPCSHSLGDIFHPLVLKHAAKIGQQVPPPDFSVPYQ